MGGGGSTHHVHYDNSAQQRVQQQIAEQKRVAAENLRKEQELQAEQRRLQAEQQAVQQRLAEALERERRKTPAQLFDDLLQTLRTSRADYCSKRSTSPTIVKVGVIGKAKVGKSTSLNAFLRKINSTDLRIITVEDPIEYEVPGVNQMQIRSEIGLTFASALRSILRQDPDVIMVGEIRDKDTAEIAIRASLTGHLVFSTLHTNDAPGAITRLVDMGIEPFLVASAIELVIAQRLVRRLCPNCCASQPISKVKLLETLAILECDAAEAELVTALKHPVGCDRCRGTGYRGRIGLFEIFRLNDELHELILKRESTRTLTQAARKQGMRTLGQSGWEKVKAGHTTLEEVLRVVTVVEK
jgi:type II secretory ATPase GspE/PulE/Tfp pilus assembly ATPase PilB-like protein